jgi:hypothetical protein
MSPHKISIVYGKRITEAQWAAVIRYVKHHEADAATVGDEDIPYIIREKIAADGYRPLLTHLFGGGGSSKVHKDLGIYFQGDHNEEEGLYVGVLLAELNVADSLTTYYRSMLSVAAECAPILGSIGAVDGAAVHMIRDDCFCC